MSSGRLPAMYCPVLLTTSRCRHQWHSRMCVRLHGKQKFAGSITAGSGNILFVEIDHEIFSTVILSLPLIQDGQLSVSGERMCTRTGYPRNGLSLPRKKCG